MCVGRALCELSGRTRRALWDLGIWSLMISRREGRREGAVDVLRIVGVSSLRESVRQTDRSGLSMRDRRNWFLRGGSGFGGRGWEDSDEGPYWGLTAQNHQS